MKKQKLLKKIGYQVYDVITYTPYNLKNFINTEDIKIKAENCLFYSDLLDYDTTNLTNEQVIFILDFVINLVTNLLLHFYTKHVIDYVNQTDFISRKDLLNAIKSEFLPFINDFGPLEHPRQVYNQIIKQYIF